TCAPWYFPPRRSGKVAAERTRRAERPQAIPGQRAVRPTTWRLRLQKKGRSAYAHACGASDRRRYLRPMRFPAVVHKHALNAVTGLVFGLAIWRVGLSSELPAVLVFIFGGVLLAVIDWRVHRLPTRLVYYTLAGVTAGLAFASLVEWDWRPFATAAAGAMLFASAYASIW